MGKVGTCPGPRISRAPDRDTNSPKISIFSSNFTLFLVIFQKVRSLRSPTLLSFPFLWKTPVPDQQWKLRLSWKPWPKFCWQFLLRAPMSLNPALLLPPCRPSQIRQSCVFNLQSSRLRALNKFFQPRQIAPNFFKFYFHQSLYLFRKSFFN